MKLNKKGFTLVELLAVIVILAVVMLVAVTAIGPVMERANKGALSSTAQIILDAAATAYTADSMNATKQFKTPASGTATYCIDVTQLSSKNYYDPKGKTYEGSVKLEITTAGSVTYSIYLHETGANYYIGGKQAKELGVDAVVTTAVTNISKCGNASQTMTTLT